MDSVRGMKLGKRNNSKHSEKSKFLQQCRRHEILNQEYIIVGN